jgi:hypothetical protein
LDTKLIEFWYSSPIEIHLHEPDSEQAPLRNQSSCKKFLAVEVQSGCCTDVSPETGFSASLPQIQAAHFEMQKQFAAQSFEDLSDCSDQLYTFFKYRIQGFQKLRLNCKDRGVEQGSADKQFVQWIPLQIQDERPHCRLLKLNSTEHLPLFDSTNSEYTTRDFNTLTAQLRTANFITAELRGANSSVRLF